jgi:hypothetical protein
LKIQKQNKIISTWALVMSILAILLCIATFLSFNFLHNVSCSYIGDKNDLLLEKFEGIKNRFTDLYIWLGFFVSLVIGAFVINVINSKNTAREQAREAFEEVHKKYKEDLDVIAKARLDAELELKIIREANSLLIK